MSYKYIELDKITSLSIEQIINTIFEEEIESKNEALDAYKNMTPENEHSFRESLLELNNNLYNNHLEYLEKENEQLQNLVNNLTQEYKKVIKENEEKKKNEDIQDAENELDSLNMI
jgi:hypothetical protein